MADPGADAGSIETFAAHGNVAVLARPSCLGANLFGAIFAAPIVLADALPALLVAAAVRRRSAVARTKFRAAVGLAPAQVAGADVWLDAAAVPAAVAVALGALALAPAPPAPAQADVRPDAAPVASTRRPANGRGAVFRRPAGSALADAGIFADAVFVAAITGADRRRDAGAWF